jgi:hypothetical protein
VNIKTLKEGIGKITRQEGFMKLEKRTDQEQVIKRLYDDLTFTEEDKEILDLILSLRIDCTIDRIRIVVEDVIKNELKPLIDDIMTIKEIVGPDGN